MGLLVRSITEFTKDCKDWPGDAWRHLVNRTNNYTLKSLIAGNVMVITNQCEQQSDFSETRGNKPVTIDVVGYMIESQNAVLRNDFKSATVSTIAHYSEMIRLITIIIIIIVVISISSLTIKYGR